MDEQDSSLTQTAEPLTKWKNTPSLEDLKKDYEEGRIIHAGQITKINTYIDNLNGTGTAAVKVPKGNSKLVPKLIRRQAEWRYAALSEPFLSSDDLFNVRGVTWEDIQSAKQNELVLNSQFSTKIDKVAFIDEYVRTAVDEGTVILHTGWDFEEVIEEVQQPVVQYVVDPEVEPLHQHLAQLKQESPSQFYSDVPEELKTAHQMTEEQGVPIKPMIVGQEVVKKPKTVTNKPTVEILDTRNVVIDPTCEGNIKKAKFVIRTFNSSISALKKSNKYKNLDKVNVSSVGILNSPDHLVSDEVSNYIFHDKPRQTLVVHEYWGFWDVDGNGILKPIVATWVGDVLIRLEDNPFPDGELPFILVHYLPVRKKTHGEPDGALLEDNQKVVGAVTRGMIDIMGKSANGQTGMRKDMLDATNRRKYEAGMDYEFNPNVDPRMGIHMHTYAEIPNSAQFMLQLQNLEAESLTGVKSFNQGITSASLGEVAAGIRGALDAASKRELGILRRLSKGIVEVGRKFIAMNAKFLEEEEVIRLTNEEFMMVRRDDLAGNFDLRLSISTPEEDNQKAEQLAFMLQTIGPDEDPSIRRMLLAEICRLRKMPDIAKKLETYEPKPDPVQQQIQQLSLEKLQAEVAALQGRAVESESNAVLHQAKTNTEQAKAAHLGADTDLKNLDFVEQESGVKQERDLQKQGAQAKAQEQTKITEHALTMEKDQAKADNDLLKEYVKSRITPRNMV